MALSYPQAAQTTKFPTNHGCETGLWPLHKFVPKFGIPSRRNCGARWATKRSKKGGALRFFYGKNDDINWYDITHWIWGFSGKQCSDKCRQIQRCIFLGTQSLLFPIKFSASGDVTMDWAEEKFTAENVTILPSKSRGSSNCSLKRNMGSTEPDNKRQWVFFLCWDRYMIKIQNPWVMICTYWCSNNNK